MCQNDDVTAVTKNHTYSFVTRVKAMLYGQHIVEEDILSAFEKKRAVNSYKKLGRRRTA